MRAAITRIAALLAKKDSIVTAENEAPPDASHSSSGRIGARTLLLRDMADSVFIVDTPDNPGCVDDSFRDAKAPACARRGYRSRDTPACRTAAKGPPSIAPTGSHLSQQCEVRCGVASGLAGARNADDETIDQLRDASGV
jgi:hypothetical protein